MQVAASRSWVQCGREFSAEEVAGICVTVARFPHLPRRELAATLCEHLNWFTLTGTAKMDACQEFLERLQTAGLLTLPALRVTQPRRSPCITAAEPVAESPIAEPLSAIAPVTLQIVRDSSQGAQWDQLVARWHPLGFRGAFGCRLRYFIAARERCLRAILLAGAARAVAVRDEWIGWSAPARRANLARVVNNSRFLILPHVRVPHLASHVLGQLARRVAADWRERWGYEPLLLETFVDPQHHAGTC